MKFYAETGPRRGRQRLADTVLGLWCLAAVTLGVLVDRGVAVGQQGAHRLEQGSSDLSKHMSEAADAAANIPLVGGEVRKPFDDASTSSHGLATSGHDLASGLGRFGLLLGLLTALVPILLALLPWCLVRLRYARRAGRLAGLRALPSGGERLLALEALTMCPPARLGTVSDDPAEDWTRGNPQVLRALSRLVLRDHGLREPTARPRRAVTDPDNDAPTEPADL